jgi:hypothetical protein
VPSALFYVVESTCNPLTVTAEVASSSLVVPAIFSNHLQALTRADQGILGDVKRKTPILLANSLHNVAYWIRFGLGNKPAGKKASTNLSCARRLVFDVACRYLFVTWRLQCRK